MLDEGLHGMLLLITLIYVCISLKNLITDLPTKDILLKKSLHVT